MRPSYLCRGLSQHAEHLARKGLLARSSLIPVREAEYAYDLGRARHHLRCRYERNSCRSSAAAGAAPAAPGAILHLAELLAGLQARALSTSNRTRPLREPANPGDEALLNREHHSSQRAIAHRPRGSVPWPPGATSGRIGSSTIPGRILCNGALERQGRRDPCGVCQRLHPCRKCSCRACYFSRVLLAGDCPAERSRRWPRLSDAHEIIAWMAHLRRGLSECRSILPKEL